MERSNLQRHIVATRKWRFAGDVHKVVGKRRQRSQSKVRSNRRQEEGLGQRAEPRQRRRRVRRTRRRPGTLVLRRPVRIHLESATNVRRSSK